MLIKTYKPNETIDLFNLLSLSPFFASWMDEHNTGVPPEIKLHPAIKDLLMSAGEAISPHALLRLPHADPTEGADPAYCRMRQKSYEGYDADTDKFVSVKLGKVLRQVFPSLSQAVITRAVETYTALQTYKLCFTQSDQELKDIMLWMTANYKEEPESQDLPVPRSCMTNPHYVKKLADVGVHPYQAYAHALGWSLAYVPVDPDDYTKGILARAIVHDDDRGNKHFVRTYAASSECQISERLEKLLSAHGYELIDDWSGYSIARIDCADLGLYGDIVAPYVDGYADYLEYDGIRIADMCTLQIRLDKCTLETYSDVYPASYPYGTPESYCRCDHCHAPENNLYTVGRNDDDSICSRCRSKHYVFVENRELWVLAGDTVELFDGNYALIEDAQYIDRFYEYALCTNVVYSEKGDEWIPKYRAQRLHDDDWEWDDLCWLDYMGNWYSDEEPHIKDPDTGLLYTEAEYEAMQRTDQSTQIGELYDTKE